MIIFLYGPDSFRSRQKLNEIIEQYRKINKGGLSLGRFDAQISGFQEFRDEFRTTPMFKEKKLIVLENVFLKSSTSSAFREGFLKNFEIFSDSGDIVLIYDNGLEILKTDPLIKVLQKKAKVQEFEFLEGLKLRNWIKKELERQNVEMGERALEKILRFVGNDLWRLSNELQKLANYKFGQKNSEITEKDVELLVKPRVEMEIFETIDAIVSKNKKLAAVLMRKHLEAGDSPLYLLHMMNFQFRNILEVKDLLERGRFHEPALKKLGLHPFVLRKSCSQAQNFSFQEIKKIYQKIFEADFNVKTGKLDPQSALEVFIAEI